MQQDFHEMCLIQSTSYINLNILILYLMRIFIGVKSNLQYRKIFYNQTYYNVIFNCIV